MEKYLEILKKYWGYDSFRSIQGEIIKAVTSGRDTLGLMPTGGGKSITFQVPALAMNGTCLVITPLIALMNDQVDRLRSLNIKAAVIHSGLSSPEIKTVLDNAVYGAYKFLYISPERLDSVFFIEKLKQMQVNLLTVDEAHCISQWGYDFRPSYLNIASIRPYLPDVPILALTATATPDVVKDIQKRLLFKSENAISTDFKRPNLVYYIRYSESKITDLLNVCKSIHGSGVVYVRNRRKTRELSELINQQGIRCDYYHAGLSQEKRMLKQQNWASGKLPIIVATNAFGMGIDKADVRHVIHFDIPDSIEAYFQEAGRAGRDGKKAFAVLIVGKNDRAQTLQRIEKSFPEIEYIKRVYQALGNFLQVSTGGGKGMAFDFRLSEFIKAFKFNSLEAMNALKILQTQGYIEFTDEINSPSRLHFIVNRDDLYQFQVKNYKFDGFIKLLLRSYTGLFSDYVYIDEDILSKRADISRDMVYQYLLKLSNHKIVNYIPAKKTPLIIYREERLDDKSIYISKESYHDRKDRFTKRLNAMLEYVYRRDECRSRMLLNYFGQTESEECGFCDFCRKKEQNIMIIEELQDVLNAVLQQLKQESITPKRLMEKVKFANHEVSSVIRHLLDQEIIRYNDEGALVLSDKVNL